MAQMSSEELQSIEKSVDLHLGRFVLKQLKSFGDEINQIELSSDATETHASVLVRSIRVAQELRKRGLGVGDLLVVCANTHNDVSIPIVASLYIGCSVFPLSMTMTKTEVKNLLAIGKPSIVFCDAEISQIFADVLSELNVNCEIVVFGVKPTESEFVSFQDFLKPTGTEDEFEVTDFDPKSTICFVNCSSGTTGLPKGVCQNHRSLGLAVILPAVASKENRQRVQLSYLSFSSVYWVSGIFNLLHSCMFGITRMNSAAPFSVELFEKALKKYKPNMMMLSPVAMSELVKHPKFQEFDMSCVTTFYVGASPISPSVIASVQKQLPNALVSNGYGMTECGLVGVNTEGTPASCGKISPWIEWKVVDPDTEEKLGPNQVGELRIKSVTLFDSYYKNPIATAEAFDSDGWFKTGDLLYYDDNNFIYIVDRIKEVMKFRNYQITPAEIEFEIGKLSDVVQVAVVGRRHPDDGEHPMAFVQKVKGSDLTAQDVKDAVISSLSDVKQLRGGVVFLENLPSTPSGKVDRKSLKKMASEVKEE